MPTSRYSLNSYIISELKSQIAIKLCFSISGKPDCDKLSEILLKEGYGSVSSTTLYRLFVNYNGVVPYKHTLNTLVNYIGHRDWDSFLEMLNSSNEFDYKTINKKQNVPSGLLYQCIVLEANTPLFAYFESLRDRESNYKSLVALDVFDGLLHVKNPEVFFSTFKDDMFVKEFVLEFAFDPAFRIKNYEHAFKLHLNEFNKVNSIDSLQDFIFYHTVLFRQYFLTKNKPETLAIGKKIYSTIPTSFNLENIYIFPRMRFKAYKLWYMVLIGESKNKIEDYILSLLDYAKITYSSVKIYERRIIFHSIAEVFCHSDVDLKYHILLKEIFKNEFEYFPSSLFEKPIKNALPYFEANGLLHYRPLV